MASSYTILKDYKGLGTTFCVELFLAQDTLDTSTDIAIQKRLSETITEFEKKYSRFRDDSLLSTLNNEHTIPYDHDMAQMLTCGEMASRDTGGIFSVFIKEALEKKGYGTYTPTTTTVPEIVSSVVITKSTITLVGNKGIDLGGIGKGYLIDKLAHILQEEFSLQYFLINGGGDIYVTSDNEKKVLLYLEHPITSSEHIGEIALRDKALCCSSSFKRRWSQDGVEVNHFIAEKEVWSASYIVGDTTTIADVYATVFCITAHDTDMLEQFSKAQSLEYLVIPDTGKTIMNKGFSELFN